MRLQKLVYLAVTLLAFAGVAMADTTDPAVGLQGDGASTGLFSLTDPNFTFTVLASDFTSIGQTVVEGEFINATGQNVTAVDLFATLIPGTPDLTYSCDPLSQYFTMCSVTPEAGGTLIRYFNPNTGEVGFGGIPTGTTTCDGVHSCSTTTPGADFGVYVRDVNGDLFNLRNTADGFKVQGTLEAPEPTSLTLLSAGVGLLSLIRRRRNKAVA
jgi:hypothetical protein